MKEGEGHQHHVKSLHEINAYVRKATRTREPPRGFILTWMMNMWTRTSGSVTKHMAQIFSGPTFMWVARAKPMWFRSFEGQLGQKVGSVPLENCTERERGCRRVSLYDWSLVVFFIRMVPTERFGDLLYPDAGISLYIANTQE